MTTRERSPIQLYTLEDVAEALRIKPRTHGELLKSRPYYVQVGRRKLMEEQDVRRSLEELRWARDHQGSKSTNRGGSPSRHSGTSGGHISTAAVAVEQDRGVRNLVDNGIRQHVGPHNNAATDHRQQHGLLGRRNAAVVLPKSLKNWFYPAHTRFTSPPPDWRPAHGFLPNIKMAHILPQRKIRGPGSWPARLWLSTPLR